MYRSSIPIILTIVLCLGFSTPNTTHASQQTKIPAFPGAEGFGKYTVGGRGGKVYEVTTLNNSGPGSLREAVDANGPRTIVFRISGNIELQSPLHVTNPYLTIAGQTAPGDGICLKNYSFITATDEIIIRNMRFRLGHAGKNQPLDAMCVSGHGRNIIVDHCSASWGVDETLSVANDPGHAGQPSPSNVTIQWCIISESLNKSVHPKGPHGFGTLAKGGWGNGYSFHHNLYAHHHARSPYPGNYTDISIDPNGLIFDFRNNVIYNWGGTFAGYNTQSHADSVTRMNFVANYYKAGPNSQGNLAFMQRVPTSKAYFTDNWMNGSRPNDPWSLVLFDSSFTDEQKAAYKQSKPIPVPEIKMDDAPAAYEKVLAGAGATCPKRDPVDTRIVYEVRNGTGQIINNEQEVDGWPVLRSTPPPPDSDHDGLPDSWELAHNLNPNDANDGAKLAASGYSNLEEYINSICK
jgi:pectate lyase